MSLLRAYTVEFAGLELGQHQFDYQLDDRFFQAVSTEWLQSGQVRAEVMLTKQENLLTFHFQLEGTVRLTCDRSLEEFDQPIYAERQLRVKFGEEFKELDEDILVLPIGSHQLDLAQHLYDYVSLSVPMRRVHPKYDDENEDQAGWSFTTSTEAPGKDDGTPPVDERWEALKKLTSDN